MPTPTPDTSPKNIARVLRGEAYWAAPAKRWATHPDAYKPPRQPTPVECDKAYHRMWGLTYTPQPKFEISAGPSAHPRSAFPKLPTLPSKIRNLRGQLQAWHALEWELSVEESAAGLDSEEASPTALPPA